MQTCSNCLQTGHNKRSCKEVMVPVAPKPVPEFPSYHSNTKMVSPNSLVCILNTVHRFTLVLLLYFADL